MYMNSERRLQVQCSPFSGIQSIQLSIDPPNGTFSPTALAAYLYTNDENSKIYYSLNGSTPTICSPFLNSSNPYIHLETPVIDNVEQLWLNLVAIAARFDPIKTQWFISNKINNFYRIESNQRRHR